MTSEREVTLVVIGSKQQMKLIRRLRIICRILVIVLAVAERDLPLLQFFAALPVELQATVTGRTDVVPKDVAHVVQHTNHTGGDRFGRWVTVLLSRRRVMRCI